MFPKKIKQKMFSLWVMFNFTFYFVFSPFAVAAAASTPAVVPASEVSSTIDRLYGTDRYETAVEIAQEGWENKSEYAVLSSGLDNNLVDALAAVPLAKLKNAPLLLTEPDSLNLKTEAELKRLGVRTIYVVTGKGVLNQKIFEELTEMGIEVISLGGNDRFETAVNIARELGSPNKIVLTTASTNADALSVASIAAAQRMPILLSDRDNLPDKTASYLKSIEGNVIKSFVIGGQGVLSESVKNMLPNPIRVGGADRYETNLEILKTFANSLTYKNSYLANGEDEHLVDALAGAPLAAFSSSPILLTSQFMTDSTREFAKLNLSLNLIVLGGESAVSPEVVNNISSSTLISKADSIEGSENVEKPKEFTDNLRITGNNVAVENANAQYSIFVQGDNITLKNVTVKGTVFIDPGEKGLSTLDNVSATNIVVLSGATESIHLTNVKAETLRIVSRNNVRIETAGLTNVGNTIVNSDAVLDVAGGSVGKVEITNSNHGEPFAIELRGRFDHPVHVSGEATVRAGVNAQVSSLEIAPESSDQTVTLEGEFESVKVNAQASINLGTTALLNELVTNAKTNLNVQSGAHVANYDNKGNEGTITGDGAQTVFDSAPTYSGGGSSETTSVTVPTETAAVAKCAYKSGTHIQLTMKEILDKNTFLSVSPNGFSVSSGTISQVYYSVDYYGIEVIHIYGSGFTSNTVVSYDGASGIKNKNGNLVEGFSVQCVTDSVNNAQPVVVNYGFDVQSSKVMATKNFTFVEPVKLQVGFGPNSDITTYYTGSSYLTTVNSGDTLLELSIIPPQYKIWYRTIDLAGNASAWVQDGAIGVINESLISISDQPSPAVDSLVGSSGAVDSGAKVFVYSDDSLSDLVGTANAASDGSFSLNLTDGVFGDNDIYYVRATTMDNNSSGAIRKFYTPGYKYVDDTTIQLTMNTPLDGNAFTISNANGFSVSGGTVTEAVYSGGVIIITGTGFTRNATVSYSGTSIMDLNNNPITVFSFQPFIDLLNEAPPVVTDLGNIYGFNVIATSTFTFPEPVKLQVYYGNSPVYNTTPSAMSLIYLKAVSEGEVLISRTSAPINSNIWYRTVDQSGNVSDWIQDGAYREIDQTKIKIIDNISPAFDVMVGEPGAVDPGATVIVYNSWDMENPLTATALPDGSFTVDLVDGVFMKYYRFYYSARTVDGNESSGREQDFVGGYNFVDSTTIKLSMNKSLDLSSFSPSSPNGFTVKAGQGWVIPDGIVTQVTYDGSYITITGTGFTQGMIISYDGSAEIKYEDSTTVEPFSFHYPWW